MEPSKQQQRRGRDRDRDSNKTSSSSSLQRGSHNRPWQAEDEYRRLSQHQHQHQSSGRRISSSSLLQEDTPSSYAKFLQESGFLPSSTGGMSSSHRAAAAAASAAAPASSSSSSSQRHAHHHRSSTGTSLSSTAQLRRKMEEAIRSSSSSAPESLSLPPHLQHLQQQQQQQQQQHRHRSSSSSRSTVADLMENNANTTLSPTTTRRGSSTRRSSHHHHRATSPKTSSQSSDAAVPQSKPPQLSGMSSSSMSSSNNNMTMASAAAAAAAATSTAAPRYPPPRRSPRSSSARQLQPQQDTSTSTSTSRHHKHALEISGDHSSQRKSMRELRARRLRDSSPLRRNDSPLRRSSSVDDAIAGTTKNTEKAKDDSDAVLEEQQRRRNRSTAMEQQRRSGSTGTMDTASATEQQHYRAHEPAVEKYLAKQKMVQKLTTATTAEGDNSKQPPRGGGGTSYTRRRSSASLPSSEEENEEGGGGGEKQEQRRQRRQQQHHRTSSRSSGERSSTGSSSRRHSSTKLAEQSAAKREALLRSAQQQQQRGSSSGTTGGAASSGVTTNPVSEKSQRQQQQSAPAATAPQSKEQGDGEAATARSRRQKQQQQPPPPASSSSSRPSSTNASLSRSKTTGGTNNVPKDENDGTTKGWSTMSRRSAVALTQRATSDSAVAVASTTTSTSKPEPTARQGDEKVNRYLESRKEKAVEKEYKSWSYDISESGTSDESSDSDDDKDYYYMDDNDYDYEEDDDDYSDHQQPNYSVKVCVVSAVDFPANVVPNLPFSPVLRVGMVKLPAQDENPQSEEDKKVTQEKQRREILTKIEAGGLLSVPKAGVLETSPKILSKRDNGSVEFHEEFRWDRVEHPQQMALAVELSSRAVMTPRNIKESPPWQKIEPPRFASATSSLGRGTALGKQQRTVSPITTPDSGSDAGSTGISGGLGSLFRRSSVKKADKTQMETANAAAAVAKLLVEGNNNPSSTATESTTTTAAAAAAAAPEQAPSSGPLFDSKSITTKTLTGNNNQSEMNVKLRPRKRRKKTRMTEDLHIGAQIIPLTNLPLKKALKGKEAARIEQWFELDDSCRLSPSSSSSSPDKTTATSGQQSSGSPSSAAKRNPSVLLEISLSTPEVLDESEDDMDEDDDVNAQLKASFSKRASMKIRSQLKEEVAEKKEKKLKEPELEPGVIDYICVVGARDIGDQKADDGSSGWVNTNPECCILEQFPPNDDFHVNNGRMVALPNKVEWFCFPEGCRIWRGTTPPNLDELNLKRFSASSPANIATSIASFDACLGCTTSFSWFVVASNSDEYGSENAKTFGAVIRFFVPAPAGIDPTQDDFAQTFVDAEVSDECKMLEGRRLWVPMGICLTSSLPIVGHMEVMLLRLCEALSVTGVSISSERMEHPSYLIRNELANLIISFQRPIPGVVHCSIPFLTGERFHLSVPPRGGLPALPHGSSVASVCRLLGADGLNFLLAAFLTECKILIHSDDIANLCLVAEVMAALIYPFTWALPYIPVLPVEMMEFIEAPLSYLLGVPSCNMKLVDPHNLADVVVVDLDKDFSSTDYFEGRRTGAKTKAPTPLPATVASNISKAIYRLLRAEEDADEEIGLNLPGARSFPRMEPESLAEREFRVAVAMEICGLVRGYQDCLVYASSSQPVFNVDRFLQIAPALFEEQRGTSASSSDGADESVTQRVLSPRSRRFMSLLVTCQHFHQFLEALETEHIAFFHEAMAALNTNDVGRRATKRSPLSLDTHKTMEQLCAFLQRMEDKVPTYRVKHSFGDPYTDTLQRNGAADGGIQFPRDLVQPIAVLNDSRDSASEHADGVKQVSIEYLMELEKNPWRHQSLFDIDLKDQDKKSLALLTQKVKLREAIGDRRYQAWKLALEQEKFDADEVSILSSEDLKSKPGNASLDLNSLLTCATADLTSSSDVSANGTIDSEQDDSIDSAERRVADAKDREIVRRCLERALASSGVKSSTLQGKFGDLISEAEAALRNPSARKFLLSVLSKRAGEGDDGPTNPKERRHSTASGASKLDSGAFEILVQLGCALLDACMEVKDYDSAYSMLKLTAGIYTITGANDDVAVSYMTSRIGLHPIYADLGVWVRANNLHLATVKESNKKDGGENQESDSGELDEDDDKYEASVATLYEMLGYGIPAEELARFASRMSELNGWFHSEKGQTIMLLARRLSVRREHGGGGSSPGKSDLELMKSSSWSVSPPSGEHRNKAQNLGGRHRRRSLTVAEAEKGTFTWVETGWCQPAAQSSRRLSLAEKSRRPGTTQSLLNMLDEQKALPDARRRNPKHMKRSAVTSMTYLGSSVVVTGGLDGGVFMARKVRSPVDEAVANEGLDNSGIRGVHLDWGSSGSRYSVGSSSNTMDGEYGVGAVTCLASTRGTHSPHNALTSEMETSTKDVMEPLDEEELLQAMEGCRVVAGTTCGDLRVWSIKDVFSAVFYSSRDIGSISTSDARLTHRSGKGMSSELVTNRRKGATDFAAGSSLTRLKFSLRGRALSGHRGGVTCIDVPSSVYRPDSIISGGADGLIKLWSLRSPGTSGGRRTDVDQAAHLLGSPGSDPVSPRTKAAHNGDALSILSGHGGRILCVKTAWHGDRLLSGGADRTVRMWDLAGSGGRCLHTLSGHFGWVTDVQYWGPNTIISASTDRSIALWDARVRSSPLFTLRHHYAPISDLVVGSRTDPIMISAARDGTVAAWDFRHLSGNDGASQPAQETKKKKKKRHCSVDRDPAATLYLHDYSRRRYVCGSVLLSRGPSRARKTIMCVGSDAIIREWDYQTGDVISEHVTGHCDLISSFASLHGDKLCDTQLENSEPLTGTITTSWDGTVRLRGLVRSDENAIQS